MIEIFAIRDFNHSDVCKLIDLMVNIIEFRDGKVRMIQLTKFNKEIFRLFR